MSTLPARTAEGKPVPEVMTRPVRKGGVRVVGQQFDGSVLVQIRSETLKGDVRGYYRITRIPSDFGDAFFLEKVPDTGIPVGAELESYHVNLDDTGSTCDCWSFLKERSCKHTKACAALSDARRV